MRKIWGEIDPAQFKTSIESFKSSTSKLDLKSELEDVEKTYGVSTDNQLKCLQYRISKL